MAVVANAPTVAAPVTPANQVGACPGLRARQRV